MGKYFFYILTAYSLTFLVIGTMFFWMIRGLRQAKETLKKMSACEKKAVEAKDRPLY